MSTMRVMECKACKIYQVVRPSGQWACRRCCVKNGGEEVFSGELDECRTKIRQLKSARLVPQDTDIKVVAGAHQGAGDSNANTGVVYRSSGAQCGYKTEYVYEGSKHAVERSWQPNSRLSTEKPQKTAKNVPTDNRDTGKITRRTANQN